MKKYSLLNLFCAVFLSAAPVALSLEGLAQERAGNGCDEGNGGLTLPTGFCASVFADNLGRARHLTVGPGGDVYVNTWSSSYTEFKNAAGGYLVALRDSNHDGKADQIERFGPKGDLYVNSGSITNSCQEKDRTLHGRDGLGPHWPKLYTTAQNSELPAAKPAGGFEEFATEFAGATVLAAPTEASYRPIGLAIAPDGALYVSDDVKGRIWRITDRGGAGI